MGFEAIFFSRMNETLKGELIKKKEMQWIWQQQFEGADGKEYYTDKGIFSYAFYHMYSAP